MLNNLKKNMCITAALAMAFAFSVTFGFEALGMQETAKAAGTEKTAEEKTAPMPEEGEYVKDHVIVVMKDRISEEKAEKMADSHGDELEGTVDTTIGTKQKTMAVVDTGSTDVDDAMESYAERSDVEYVQPDYVYRKAETGAEMSFSKEAVSGDDDYTDLQWALGSDGVDAESAWTLMESIPHSKVRVAVLDTGIDLDQPDLQENLDTSRCYNSYISGGSKAEKDIADLDGHGTHVAGIIAADNNGYGVSGIASGKDNSVVSLFAVKVFDKGGSEATSASIARGINYAVKKGAKVINLSLGAEKNTFSSDTSLHNAVDSAYSKGVTVVCAAGNDGTDGFSEIPASYSKAVSVSSAGPHSLIHYSSSYGSTVDLAAPGVNILSLYPGWAVAMESGTSMASPAVSAAAAMVYSVSGNSVSADAAFSKKVRSILFNSATDLYSTGKDIYSGYGLVNAANAVKAASGQAYSKKSKKTSSVKNAKISYASVKLNWPSMSTGSKYRIQKRQSSKYNYKYSTVKTVTGRSYTVKKLSTGKKYRFRVLVYDTSGFGAGTWYVLGERTAVPKLSKAKISVSPLKGRKVRVSWKKVGGAAGYRVYRASKKTGSYKVVAKISKNSRSMENGSLKKGKKYYYKVRAWRGSGSSRSYGACSDAAGVTVR